MTAPILLFLSCFLSQAQASQSERMVGGGHTCSPHQVLCDGQLHISYACAGQDECAEFKAR